MPFSMSLLKCQQTSIQTLVNEDIFCLKGSCLCFSARLLYRHHIQMSDKVLVLNLLLTGEFLQAVVILDEAVITWISYDMIQNDN